MGIGLIEDEHAEVVLLGRVVTGVEQRRRRAQRRGRVANRLAPVEGIGANVHAAEQSVGCDEHQWKLHIRHLS